MFIILNNIFRSSFNQYLQVFQSLLVEKNCKFPGAFGGKKLLLGGRKLRFGGKILQRVSALIQFRVPFGGKKLLLVERRLLFPPKVL